MSGIIRDSFTDGRGLQSKFLIDSQTETMLEGPSGNRVTASAAEYTNTCPVQGMIRA